MATTELHADRAPRTFAPSRITFDYLTIVFTAVLLAVGFVIIYPILLLLISSFQVGPFGQEQTLGWDNWAAALSQPALRQSLVNTLTLTATRQGIALVIGITVAWLLARTNVPGRSWIEFGFWIASFLPTLTVLLGWIILFDGSRGLVNQWARNIGFTEPPFEIFSWWGIVWVHITTGTLPVKVILLTPAFRNMDSSLEEASRAAGANTLTTFWRVLIPIMAPTILVVLLLGVIRSMEAFEIELILGAPDHIEVYSTLIYRQVFQQPPEYGTSAALSMAVLAFLVPLIALQQWLTTRRSVTTVSGKFAGRQVQLGRWKWPIFGVLVLMVAVMTALPVSLVVMSTFMRLFGFFTADPWTLNNWATTLQHPNFLSSLRNTLVMGGSAAVLSVVIYSLIAYLSVKTRIGARGVLDFLTWLPTAIPGVVISLGFLWMFLQTPFFRPLYNSMFILVLAILIGSLTVGVQVIKAALLQLGNELEEASSATGASWMYTARRIILPLIAPSLGAVAMLTFATAVRSTGLVALLSTRSIAPLSILQLDYLADGSFERASVVGVVVFSLTLAVALLARLLSLRAGGSARGE
ncbi:MAG TPA: iron ABC transporter permease [Chloroflexota bacterium]|jgi:iron(III) transport system permease protein